MTINKNKICSSLEEMISDGENNFMQNNYTIIKWIKHKKRIS